jgi:hypothetical protein
MGLALALVASQALAQAFRPGERVKASPLAMNTHWEDCTVVSVAPQGDVNVACGPRNTEYLVQAKWVKRSAGAAPKAGPPQEQATQAAPRVAATRQQSSAAHAAADLCPNAPRSLVGRRPQEHGICRVGSRVTDRQGRTGTVIAALDGASCQVCFSDGSSRGYLTWMLAAAGASSQSRKEGGGVPASGNYQCSGGAAGNMRITINGGRWNEFYAKTLPDGRVGLSKQPNGEPYYMICERR